MSCTDGFRQVLTAALALVLALTSCSEDAGDGESCRANLLAGDLVLTEVMANPAGTDEGKEWFEIYNATAAQIDLGGVRLVKSKIDLSGEKSHTMAPITIGVGQYAVLGGVLDVARPDWVDYAYAPDLSDLGNTSGRLAVYCNAVLVDEMTYEGTADGISIGFDGSQTPDSVANDSAGNWCEGSEEYEEGSFGSPGEAHDDCFGDLPAHQCLDGGVPRDKVLPLAGDLVLTEILPDPVGAEAEVGGKEWFEVFATRDVDLNGVAIGKFNRDEAPDPADTEMTVPQGDCVRVTGGSYAIFAGSADAQTNGGLPAVDVVIDFSLTNTKKGIFLALDETVLDAITYNTTREGKAHSLDPFKRDASDNDNEDYWCDAVAAYGPGEDLGSPGADNPSCGIVDPGKCIDGAAQRDKVEPQEGDLVLTEFMANPDAVDDAAGEWFEVYVGRDLDLNGLELGRMVADGVALTIPEGECLRVTAGSHVLFARESNAAINGGLPAVDAVFDFSLNNTNKGLFVGYGGAVLDAITYSSTSAGASTALDPGWIDPADNDDPAHWCDGTAAYGDGDLGTPGAGNAACP